MSEEQDDDNQERAVALFQRAHRLQMRGAYADAIRLYQASLELHPTAEAHTFLGWTYSMLGRHEQAIEECHRAIAVDPDFGNPYNDIGAYLLEMERWEEALPWFEKAIVAPRYDARVYPFVNKGRALEHLGRTWEALQAYRQAMKVSPDYQPARQAYRALLGRLN
jgi:tetratricopeptide (TPR) repeat protein